MRKMPRKISLLFNLVFLIILSIPTYAQVETSDQTIFLVRHAEKADDGTRDPDLTGIGKRRAEKLSVILKQFDIQKIYSTDYKRTRQTAQPLASMLGLQVELYDPRGQKILENLKKEKGSILIVGHSNSTPTLTNAILGEKKYEKLDESVYTKLFILSRVNGSYGSAVSEF